MRSTASIQELPAQERPQEKLVSRGIEALTDAEVLAILLRTGVTGTNAVALGQALLDEYGSLAQLARAPVADLARHHGVGVAKAIQLVAGFALGSRLAGEHAAGD